MGKGLVEGSAESRSRRRFVTRRGEGERGGNLIWCTVDTSWDTSWWTPAGAQ